METSQLKKYAPKARREFIEAVSNRCARIGLDPKGNHKPIEVKGDFAIIEGEAYPKSYGHRRKRLEDAIEREGFAAFVERIAYTWFNRLMAIRFMELNGYLEHEFRVLSNPSTTNPLPEILQHAQSAELPGLKPERIAELQSKGDADEELYREILLAQCHALYQAMPFLFERIDDATELLLPDGLLHTDSLIRSLVESIDEELWKNVEIVGWLYQFYISEKKDVVIGKTVKSEDIPAATQLFTPNWIVQYLVQNSIGAQWLATYSDSGLKGQMPYYIEPAEQDPEVQAKLDEITPDSLDPEKLTLLDPACGSGHILVEAYNLFHAIYTERGYPRRDIPSLILRNNLFGLEIDERAAQLASFALLMRARRDDRSLLKPKDDQPVVQPNIVCIQESNELDAKDITEALNAPLRQGEATPIKQDPLGVAKPELIDTGRNAPNLWQQKSGQLSVSSSQGKKQEPQKYGNVLLRHVQAIVDTFQHAKTFGSLIKVDDDTLEGLDGVAQRCQEVLQHGDLLNIPTVRPLWPLIQQALVMRQRYDAVVANPPYMGGKGMNKLLKDWAKQEYPRSKSDLFAMFIEQGFDLLRQHGHNAMVTMQSWMFLSSYEKMREHLLGTQRITTMAHLGARAFREISGEVVQATAFSATADHIAEFRPSFFRLVEGNDTEKFEALLANEHRHDTTRQSDFGKIPGSPIAYWLPINVLGLFEAATLERIADARPGLQTSDNDRFLRRWYEVDFHRVALHAESRSASITTKAKWFPCNKGGPFRRWFGNWEYLVNWENDGEELFEFASELYGSPTRIIKNASYYFRRGVTWSDVTSGSSSFRLSPGGAIFDATGHTAFFANDDDLYSCLAILNTNLIEFIAKVLNPTMHFHVGYFRKLPLVFGDRERHLAIAREAVEIAKSDWDSFEISWGFNAIGLIDRSLQGSIQADYESMRGSWLASQGRLCDLETENNTLIRDVVGYDKNFLGDSTPEVALTCNPHYRYGGDKSDEELEALLLTDTIQELCSYSIGCMMGRYSLDEPGLIYAHSGGHDFEEVWREKVGSSQLSVGSDEGESAADATASQDSQLSADTNHQPPTTLHFLPDDDGIIPLTHEAWFEDDCATRFEEFIATAWPKDTLEENLSFVAEALGAKKNESARDTIRRYFAFDFFKDHMQTYKKRPIYWLFTSNDKPKLKQPAAFQCLVYLHRYNEGTLARMRTQYLLPLISKLRGRIKTLGDDPSAAEYERQLTEALEYDEKLKHFADQRIALDLDDGVKVNYGKFGDPHTKGASLLAMAKDVVGKKKK